MKAHMEQNIDTSTTIFQGSETNYSARRAHVDW
jgi:hypothetical protein